MKAITIGTALLAVLLLIVAGCSAPPKAKNGDKVKVHYTGRLEDGTVFDSSTDREPIEFVIGSGRMIAGFDRGVVGMSVGETKTITLAPEDAYGYPTDERIMEIDRAQFPEDLELEVGMELGGFGPFPARVTELTDDVVTVDANHPMAGKTLIFDLELVEIVSPEGEG